MHFGDFLVQQKVLSAHQVLRALAEQRRRRQFIPLLLVELEILPDYQALHYCSKADVTGSDFLDVMVHEGLISDEQRLLIHDRWMCSGPPLGILLVEMGLMDAQTRQELLDEFEAERELEMNLAKLSAS